MLTRTNFFRLTIAALVALNLATLAFFRFGWPHPPRPGLALKKTIVERLHFDAAQTASYEQLIAGHRKAVQEKDHELAQLRQALYNTLATVDTTGKDSLVQRIGAVHAGIEQLHYAHFQAIKGLCRPDQAASFDQLSGELARFFAPPPMDEPKHGE